MTTDAVSDEWCVFKIHFFIFPFCKFFCPCHYDHQPQGLCWEILLDDMIIKEICNGLSQLDDGRAAEQHAAE